jgi:hypothetical protein
LPKNFNQKLVQHKGVQFLEPQLSFTNKISTNISRDFHPMRGLCNHRPYDFLENGIINSNEINIGVICPKQYSARLNTFLNQLNQQHNADFNPDYLIDYPGFASAYNIALNIPHLDSDKWIDVSITHTATEKSTALNLARLITSKLEQLASNNSKLIITIFIPNEWQAFRKYIDDGESFDLHDYIKAFAASKGIATQLIEEDTLSDTLKCQKFWWLSLSYYVKSLRTPWVLDGNDLSTAFAGIGYSIDKKGDKANVVIGCSHIYNSQGQGLKYKLSKVGDFVLDKQMNPYLSYNDAFQFGVSIRELFLNSMDRLPTRVVVHKRTRFTIEEIKGIVDSLSMAGIDKIDLIEINYEQDARFFATRVNSGDLVLDAFGLSRGTCVLLDNNSALLWTHGIVPSVRNPNNKYYLGGRNIPAPLRITKHYGSSNVNLIASEILGLTKVNWNSFDLYTKLPATINSSNQIARIGNLLSRFEGKVYDYRYFI